MPPTKLSSLSFEAKLARAKEGDRVSIRTRDNVMRDGTLMRVNVEARLLQVIEDGKKDAQPWHMSLVTKLVSGGEEWERRA